MKTHEIAKLLGPLASDDSSLSQDAGLLLMSNRVRDALSEVSRLLLQSPNMEVANAKLMKKTDEVAVTLKALASLSKYSKQQWVSIIEEFNLPVELNPRASARDVVGKVLSYLEMHPEVLQTQRRTTTKTTASSLDDTLNKLLDYK